MAIKAIFFDMDETLIGTSLATNVAYQHTKEHLHEKNTSSLMMGTLYKHADKLIETFSHSLNSIKNEEYKLQSPRDIRIKLWDSAIQRVLTENNATISFDESLKSAEDLYKIWHDTRLNNLKMLEPTSLEVLCRLRKRYRLLLLTNGSSVVQWEKIKTLNFEKYFDYVLVSGDEPYDKPHPSIFQKACSICHCLPDECTMVGDTIETDIKGANDAKLAMSIYYERDCNKIEVDHYDDPSCIPSHRINSISDLLKIFMSKPNIEVRASETITC
uniref:N-acylneuraminate-9-phosphatase-like n=1 Tax=Styela clava TaxID=7725 RepID=UPI001939632B|nr:N-acylneuraminate-9-phosphatase-like [Styela clava]